MRFNRGLPATLVAAGLALAGSATAHADDFYLGQIITMATTYCPNGTMEASGQTLPILQNQALYALFGNTYGGNAPTTFQLPNLNGRSVIGAGSIMTDLGTTPPKLGEKLGQSTVTLSPLNIPPHQHATTSPSVETYAAVDQESAGVTGTKVKIPTFAPMTAGQSATNMVVATGISQGAASPVSVQSPAIGLKYCVVTSGLWPQRPD